MPIPIQLKEESTEDGYKAIRNAVLHNLYEFQDSDKTVSEIVISVLSKFYGRYKFVETAQLAYDRDPTAVSEAIDELLSTVSKDISCWDFDVQLHYLWDYYGQDASEVLLQEIADRVRQD